MEDKNYDDAEAQRRILAQAAEIQRRMQSNYSGQPANQSPYVIPQQLRSPPAAPSNQALASAAMPPVATQDHQTQTRTLPPPQAMPAAAQPGPAPGQHATASSKPTPPPSPMPANPIANATKPLPPILQPGGLINQVLERSTKLIQPGHPAAALAAALRGYIEQLREHLVLFFTRQNPTLDPNVRVAGHMLTTKKDGVLDLCLEYGQDQKWTEETWRKAWTAYEQQPANYVAILGDLIPPSLVQQVEAKKQRVAFVNGNNPTAAEDLRYLCDRPARFAVASTTCLSTGFPSLDAALGGGLRQYVLLGGDTGTGKSTLALNMLTAALRKDKNLCGLYYSLEPSMTRKRHLARLVCAEAGIHFRDLMTEPWPEGLQQQIVAAQGRLTHDILGRLRIIDCSSLDSERRAIEEEFYNQPHEGKASPKTQLTPERILRRCGELQEHSKVRNIAVVIDYLQKLETPPTMAYQSLEADRFRIDFLDRLLLGLQPVEGVVLAVSEVRKSAARQERLSLDDIAGSVRSVYAAETVLLLEPVHGADPAGAVTPSVLAVAKGRDGVIRTDVRLDFDHGRCQFKEVNQAREAAHPQPAKRQRGGRKGNTATESIADPLAGAKKE